MYDDGVKLDNSVKLCRYRELEKLFHGARFHAMRTKRRRDQVQSLLVDTSV